MSTSTRSSPSATRQARARRSRCSHIASGRSLSSCRRGSSTSSSPAASDFNDSFVVGARVSPPRGGRMSTTAFVICGALGAEVKDIVDRRGWDVDIYGLSAMLHLYPKRIVEELGEKLRALRPRYDRLVVVYGDCGTNGRLEPILERGRRIAGARAALLRDVCGRGPLPPGFGGAGQAPSFSPTGWCATSIAPSCAAWASTATPS